SDRLFLAVALTDEVRHGLAAFLSERVVRLPGRPAPPDNWHLTLRFLGATDALQRDRILEFLDEHLVVEPFTVGFTGLGAFPKPSRATVLWLGVGRGSDRVAAMARVGEEAAISAGFEPEDRPFHPHLTLSRIRPPVGVDGIIEQVGSFPLKMEVDRVTLYRSHLGRDGARYETVDEILL
ncbi:MAG: RNA 2',3'-cyclic phosphodiesterase, partial [Actinomycetota bacterium]|nr:RNA 2',3'-cyclic phosphodiesterase [Actinomycetota bacterium]